MPTSNTLEVCPACHPGLLKSSTKGRKRMWHPACFTYNFFHHYHEFHGREFASALSYVKTQKEHFDPEEVAEVEAFERGKEKEVRRLRSLLRRRKKIAEEAAVASGTPGQDEVELAEVPPQHSPQAPGVAAATAAAASSSAVQAAAPHSTTAAYPDAVVMSCVDCSKNTNHGCAKCGKPVCAICCFDRGVPDLTYVCDKCQG